MQNHILERLRQLSPNDLAALGVRHIAYVKQVVGHDQVGWSIHAADGTQIAVADQREMAIAAARQQHLEPLSVH